MLTTQLKIEIRQSTGNQNGNNNFGTSLEKLIDSVPSIRWNRSGRQRSVNTGASILRGLIRTILTWLRMNFHVNHMNHLAAWTTENQNNYEEIKQIN